MRYPAGGGLNAAARARREAVRRRAATLFQKSRPTAEIASELRVSKKSVRERWRRWIAGGTAALASGGLAKLVVCSDAANAIAPNGLAVTRLQPRS
ncbi:helix-turn-helix domain-containing protein [Phytohabitans sp. LJ34]|uniref:helix-turn-helix domain-containing protein n=1 Tax=Phytohabitans sp. LJ34 TaxID=3452217 RepID=UPI003F89A1FF